MDEWIRNLLKSPGLMLGGHLQRQEDSNLGLGWLYYALARIIRPSRAVVIGSFRGFTPIVIAKGIQDNGGGGRVTFIDPSYADDFWKSDAHVAEYFAGFGLHNVDHVLMTTQEFCKTDSYYSMSDIGLLFIDGYHTYQHAKGDYGAFIGKLSEEGMVLCHDSAYFGISRVYGEEGKYLRGVPNFVEELRADDEMQVFDFHFDEGAALISKRPKAKIKMREGYDGALQQELILRLLQSGRTHGDLP